MIRGIRGDLNALGKGEGGVEVGINIALHFPGLLLFNSYVIKHFETSAATPAQMLNESIKPRAQPFSRKQW